MSTKTKEANYFIKSKKNDGMYVHYNPHKQEYIAGDGKFGAAVFHYDAGTNFMKLAKMDQEWELEKFDVTNSVSADRRFEKKIYDVTHQ